MVTHAAHAAHMRGGERCINMRRCENRCVSSSCDKRQPSASAVKKALRDGTEPKMEPCTDHVCTITPVFIPANQMAGHLAFCCLRRKVACPGGCGERVCSYLVEAHLGRVDLFGKHLIKALLPRALPVPSRPLVENGLCVMDTMKHIPTGLSSGNEYDWKHLNWITTKVRIKSNEWTVQVQLDATNPRCKKAKWRVFVGMCQRLLPGEAVPEGSSIPHLSRSRLHPTITTEFYSPSLFNGGKEFGAIDIPLWKNNDLDRNKCTTPGGSAALVIKVHRFDA